MIVVRLLYVVMSVLCLYQGVGSFKMASNSENRGTRNWTKIHFRDGCFSVGVSVFTAVLLVIF